MARSSDSTLSLVSRRRRRAPAAPGSCAGFRASYPLGFRALWWWPWCVLPLFSGRCGIGGAAGAVLSRGEVRRELIELELPEAAVALDPCGRRAHRGGEERRPSGASLTPYACEAGALEYAYVF